MLEKKKIAIAVSVASAVVGIITAAALVAFAYSWYEGGLDNALESAVSAFAEVLGAAIVALFFIACLVAIFACVFMGVARLIGVEFPSEDAIDM